MTSMSDAKKLHIVMFPWLAFGHIIPYLELAKLIAQKGHLISFVSTPKNIDRLPKLTPNLAPLFNFVKFPLPNVENLPRDAEATSDVPYNKVQYLYKALDGLQESMARFIKTSKPDWVFHDFAHHWMGRVAAENGVRCVFFSIVIPAVLCFIGDPSVLEGDDYRTKPDHFTVPPEWVTFPTNVAFRYHEVAKTFDNMEADVSGLSVLKRFGASIRCCDLVAVRGCFELDREWLHLLEKLYKKRVFLVGELPTTENSDSDINNDNETWHSIKGWLDQQDKGTVVYVAFGSEAKPGQDEITEIALGLELSGLPFFWVLRTRRGLSDTEVIQLPEGFEERTMGRGLVRTSWVPQLKILAHDSIGGMLTHSGWSSVVEAIQFERALILLTFIAEQGLNNRVLEEKKIGYSIPRNEQDGSFTRNSVADSIRLVMVEEEGKMYKDKVKEMRELFGDREKQEEYVDNLLNYLENHASAGAII